MSLENEGPNMSVHVHVFPNDLTDIIVDNQRLCRLTKAEVKEVMLKLFMFQDKEFRTALTHWLNGGKLDPWGKIPSQEKL